MSKHIVIVGAGVVGVTCARRLSRDGHDVVIIERDEELVREITDRLDVQVVTGNGCSLPRLREAGLDGADLLLAVTDSDEVNMITALIAGSSFEVRSKVIRLRSADHLENLPELARSWPGTTHAINPDRAAADRVLSLVHLPEAVDVAELLGGRVTVAGFRIERESRLAGRTMSELAGILGHKVLIPVIYRDRRALLPSGETVVREGDIAYFSSVPQDLAELLRSLGREIPRQSRLIIGGGGGIGRLVARGALADGQRVTLIRRRMRQAERLAVEFPDAEVLHGDILEEELLEEAGVGAANTFIAATDDQETNLISSMLARRLGCPRAIPLIDNSSYLAVAEGMGIDAAVSPRLASVSEILRFVRGAHYEEVASLPHEMVELAVVEVDHSSPLAEGPIHSLPIPEGVILAAVATDDRVFVPGGADRIPVGSKVVTFSLAEVSERLMRLVEHE